VKLRPSTATVAPYRLVRSLTSISWPVTGLLPGRAERDRPLDVRALAAGAEVEDQDLPQPPGRLTVRTKLLAYSIGAAFGGMSGAFFGAYYTEVNAGQFQFGFSIFILAMVIIGGLGSIWGAMVGGLALGYINNYLIPDVLNGLPASSG